MSISKPKSKFSCEIALCNSSVVEVTCLKYSIKLSKDFKEKRLTSGIYLPVDTVSQKCEKSEIE